MSTNQKLSNYRIPLRPPDDDVLLDLTAVFNRTYDIGSYDLLINYSQPPDTTLRDVETAWLNTHLQDNGIRSA